MSESPQLWIRERGLALLFIGALAAAAGFILLAERLPTAARTIGVVFGGLVLLLAIRSLARAGRRRRGHAPAGPLSRDETAKARSKLLKSKP